MRSRRRIPTHLVVELLVGVEVDVHRDPEAGVPGLLHGEGGLLHHAPRVLKRLVQVECHLTFVYKL